ncbi:hypothetical protein MEBOL_006970 [Melittangium boletus DSM 14713]|uniref:HTH tetR-type domain-containing protein n=2 Tax=Melittangium boletus TaxID=83453 RepID=A0A250IQE8_9BACT|nr:hypothetical protein MEBOL_006970 [Melittangium boletus DSM 14713]
MDDLAREAGLSRATLYRQAGSRDTVLAALSEQGVDVGRRSDVRERILAACRPVFTRAGFDAATLEEVASEAGVGPATVYRQFGDKDGLIRAFAEHIGPRRAIHEVVLTPSGDVRADLERVATAAIRRVVEDVDLLRLGLLERLRGGTWAEHLKASPFRVHRSLTQLLEFYAASGTLESKDPQRMARVFIGMLFSSFAELMLERGPPPDPEDTARFITHVFLEGLASADRRKP